MNLNHALVLASLTLLGPTLASAQTITVQIEGEVEVDAEAGVGRGAWREEVPRLRSGAVALVRPEDDHRLRAATEMESSYVVADSPSCALDGQPLPCGTPFTPTPAVADPTEGWFELALFLEAVDLSGVELSFTSPEVRALAGVSLTERWGGRQTLSDSLVGGLSLGWSARIARFLRGPGLRVQIGGGELDRSAAVSSQAPDFELAAQSILFLRAEVAFGLQLPLGEFTPYLMGIASVGVGFLDVSVQHRELGRLGTETLTTYLLGAGLEAGLDFALEDGVALGLAARVNLAGNPSGGAAIQLTAEL